MSDTNSFLTRWLRLKAKSGKSPQESSPLDISKLPPIQSLTAESDISVFLQPGVPADLVREALNRAWRTDPAILDFVGIAEMQWDLNDPAAMPGFGVLEPDSAHAVVQLSSQSTVASQDVAIDLPRDQNPGRDGQPDPVWTAAAAPVYEQPTTSSLQQPCADASEDTDASGRPRRHGSALPKPHS